MSVFFPFSMFYLSFFPLWISILFVDIKAIVCREDQALWTESISIVVILTLALSCSIILWKGMCKRSKEQPQKYYVIQAKEQKTVTTEYLLSCILPLFAFDFTKWDKVVLFLIFFITICFLCLKHNHFVVNIILEVTGYSFYECQIKDRDGNDTYANIISKHKLNTKVGIPFRIRHLNNEYMLTTEELCEDTK